MLRFVIFLLYFLSTESFILLKSIRQHRQKFRYITNTISSMPKAPSLLKTTPSLQDGLSSSSSLHVTRQPPSNVKILILPGFGNDSSDYYLSQYPNGSIVNSLIQRGWDVNEQIYVLPMKRSDWLQVFINGIFDIQFWQGIASPTRPAFRWYIERIIQSIDEITKTNLIVEKTNIDNIKDSSSSNEGIKVLLIGHSAGGWLARAALGCGSLGNSDNILDNVCGLVTLGAPHTPPPPNIMDMTRGALKYTASMFPGAYHNNIIFYITIIGDAVKGIKQERNSPFEQTSISGFAYNSYEAVSGIGDLIGDGVVPVIAGHLEGALQLNLKGIFHSINAPDRWYGSDSVIDQWHSDMLDELDQYNGKPVEK